MAAPAARAADVTDPRVMGQSLLQTVVAVVDDDQFARLVILRLKHPDRLKREFRYHFILKSASREKLNGALRAMIAGLRQRVGSPGPT